MLETIHVTAVALHCRPEWRCTTEEAVRFTKMELRFAKLPEIITGICIQKKRICFADIFVTEKSIDAD